MTSIDPTSEGIIAILLGIFMFTLGVRVWKSGVGSKSLHQARAQGAIAVVLMMAAGGVWWYGALEFGLKL